MRAQFILVVACLFLHHPVLAQSWTYTRIADSSTIAPGAGGAFESFGLPSIRSGEVAFAGHRTQEPLAAGIYRGSGGALSVVADRTTAIPGGSGSFTAFARIEGFWPSMSGPATAFVGDGFGTSFIQRGIYVNQGGLLTRAADRGTPMPNSTADFFNFSPPSLDAGQVGFVGRSLGNGQSGVFRWQGGVLSVVADRNTPIPGGSSTFSDFSDCFVHAGEVAFTASGAGGYQGIFRAESNGAIIRLYDTTMPMPGQPGNFELISRPIIQNGSVVFRGANSIAGAGIFTDLSGTLDVVANQSTPVPGSPGSVFGSFGYPAFDQSVIAFTASAVGGNTGVYSTHLGTVGKVLAGGDFFDGRIVRYAIMGPQGLSGDSIAIHVEFTDNTYGIYRATIPAPSAAAALMLGSVLAARRRRRS